MEGAVDIVEILEDRLKIKPDGKLTSIALVGSRAGNFHRTSSDFDFDVVLNSDIKRQHHEFTDNGSKIDVIINSKRQFEDRLRDSGRTFDRSRYIWLPYVAITGEDYLSAFEQEIRQQIVDQFIQQLPPRKDVLVRVRDIVEWPLIAESRRWPPYSLKLQPLTKAEKYPLITLEQKYNEILAMGGLIVDNHGIVILNNRILPYQQEASHRVLTQRLRNFSATIRHDPVRIAAALCLAASLIPEEIVNRIHPFPAYETTNGYLMYRQPTLDQYLHSRRIFRPLWKSTAQINDFVRSVRDTN